MSLTIERTVLTQLVSNEEYTRKVLPFLKGDYFSDRSERIVFEEITKFVEKYNKIPTKTSLEIEIQSRKDLNESDFKNIISLVKSLHKLLMERIKVEMQMLFRAFSLMPWLLVLIIVWVMIISQIHLNDLTTIMK